MNAWGHLREQVRVRKLVRQVIAGDADAYGTLYDQYAPRVWRMLCRLCHNSDEAEDLTQETFLAVPDALKQWRGDAALFTFVCGIAYRKWARARRDTRPTVPLDDAKAVQDSGDLSSELSRQELARALDAAIRNLPDDLRAVFTLVRVEEMAYRDAAHVLEIPLGTVQSRLHRAHRVLRVALTRAVPELVPDGSPHVLNDLPSARVVLAVKSEKGATAHVLD